MYSQGKYITGEIKGDITNTVTALCFCELVTHSTFRNKFEEIWGSGFFYVNEDGEVVVEGKSVSLGVESRGEKDAFLIRRALGMEPSY